jgi:aspartate/methionine/tyrosine aminotransferase
VKFVEFGLERFFSKHEFKVKHLLCASNIEAMSVRELLALDPAATERLMSLQLGYTETLGHPELREAIGGLFESKPQVLVFTGAQEPIFTFMYTQLAPGDDLIVHVPCYQSLHEVARHVGAGVIPFHARPEARWQLDPDELAKLVTPKTRGIVINSPHNPTGAVLTRDRFDAIVSFARERGLWLFSDEVYRGLEIGERNPSAVDVYERAFCLGTTAKTYGLAGLRIGWIATHDQATFDRLHAFKDYLTICNAAPSELLTSVAMRHAEELAARGRKIVAENTKLWTAFMQKHAELSWVAPLGGSTAFVKRAGGEAWCALLLEKKGIAFAPGRLFGGDSEHFRVGLGRSGLAAGLLALDA